MRRLLSVIILTRDEEKNLPFALKSLKNLNADIIVVDSGSTDRTSEIALAAGCRIFDHSFATHADQVNWALDNISIESEWVMRLDADERLMPELVTELHNVLPKAPSDVTGWMLKRRVYFWNRWIKHGGYYPTWLLRVWRRGSARCEDRDMDEHMLVQSGRIEKLRHDIIDENHKGLGFWIDKHNRFSDKEVVARSRPQKEVTVLEAGLPTARKRFLKNNLYYGAPRYLRALMYWAYRYFILLGFLDGRPGLVFHFLQGFWYRFVVDAKLEERMHDGWNDPNRSQKV